MTTATTLGIPDYRPAPLPPPTAPQYKLRNLFSGAFDRVPDVTPLPVTVPRHTKGQLEYAAALLGAAKKPVFIVASQATLFDGRVRSADEVRGAVCVRGSWPLARPRLVFCGIQHMCDYRVQPARCRESGCCFVPRTLLGTRRVLPPLCSTCTSCKRPCWPWASRAS